MKIFSEGRGGGVLKRYNKTKYWALLLPGEVSGGQFVTYRSISMHKELQDF